MVSSNKQIQSKQYLTNKQKSNHPKIMLCCKISFISINCFADETSGDKRTVVRGGQAGRIWIPAWGSSLHTAVLAPWDVHARGSAGAPVSQSLAGRLRGLAHGAWASVGLVEGVDLRAGSHVLVAVPESHLSAKENVAVRDWEQLLFTCVSWRRSHRQLILVYLHVMQSTCLIILHSNYNFPLRLINSFFFLQNIQLRWGAV